MTKEQLEEKIKNNESVYDSLSLEEITLNSDFVVTLETHSNQLYLLNKKEKQFYTPINELFSTEAQAQHYFDNGNVTRTERLPYITWEEFKNGKNVIFRDKDKFLIEIYISENWIYNTIVLEKDSCSMFMGNLTEENFYKAYDIARKLFLGEVV